MARQRKCDVCPEWHDTDEPWPSACMGHYKRHLGVARSDLPSPAIIGDELPGGALECPADGKTYTSKRAYYAAVKAAGCEILGSKEKLPPRERVKPKLTDAMRREIRQKVAALDTASRPKRPPRDYFGGSRRFSAP